MSRKTRWVLFVLLGIWAFAMVPAIPFLITAYREKEVVDETMAQHVASLVASDYQRAYDSCGSDFRTATPFSVFVQQHKALIERHGKLRGFRKGGSEVSVRKSEDEWVARLNITLTFEQQEVLARYEFHREGGRWVIYGYQIPARD